MPGTTKSVVVVECTGTAPGMNLTLDLVNPLGRVSLPGLPHAGQQVPLLMEKVVLAREKEEIGNTVS